MNDKKFLVTKGMRLAIAMMALLATLAALQALSAQPAGAVCKDPPCVKLPENPGDGDGDGSSAGSGTVRLLSITCFDITDDEGGVLPPQFGGGFQGDHVDESYITINGRQVWSGNMIKGSFVNLAQLDVSVKFSGATAQVQLQERDPGDLEGIGNAPDDNLGGFSAQYTDGQPQTNIRNGNGGTYLIEYVVVR